jgi:hypothetical protein
MTFKGEQDEPVTRAFALVFAVPFFVSATARADDESGFVLAPQRYTYVAGAAMLLAGLGAGYIAQGDTSRAQSAPAAPDARSAYQDAQLASSTANLLYCLAALTVAYGLVLELLPPSITEKATLTFHF